MKLADLSGRLLYAMAWLIGRLPLRALHAIGELCAYTTRLANAREYRVARRNIQLIGPDASAAEHEQRARAVLRGTWRCAMETLRFWTRSSQRNLRAVRDVHGGELFESALADRRGAIIAAPHYGNWELLNQFLAARTPIAILYLAPDSAVVEGFLRRVRERPGVTAIRADAGGVRRLLRHLHAGGVVGILPDQQPKLGDGVFAPFFGIDALSMSLLPRLAERSGATVLFAIAERAPDATHFDIHFQRAPEALAGSDLHAAAAAMNAAVETIARRDESQYQWTYKRFSRQPQGKNNPYWPDCYPRQR
jgi:KDO2-lipid IV(A) lauroyltransferase